MYDVWCIVILTEGMGMISASNIAILLGLESFFFRSHRLIEIKVNCSTSKCIREVFSGNWIRVSFSLIGGIKL